MLKCIFFLGSPKKLLSWFCQFVFNFFFARRHSLMWNISQGCTTGMPAPMLAPPSAMSAATASQGSLLMASPVKVGAHFLCLRFPLYLLISLSSVSANPCLILDAIFADASHLIISCGWEMGAFFLQCLSAVADPQMILHRERKRWWAQHDEHF